MHAPVSENISAAKAGGLIVLLLAGWLAYQTLSGPAVTPAASSKEMIPPPSSLVRAGLRDYTDWEGLPEIFAVWSDKAQWKNGRTRFAYWHPVMKNYSYYFEAIKTTNGYRFREIPEPPTSDFDHYWDESLGEDCPIRFYRSPELKKSSPPRAPAKPALDREEPDPHQQRIPLKETQTIPVIPPAKT